MKDQGFDILNKMDRHAYLIKAHNQFELLHMVCRLLDHPNHDLFIHIDKKATDFDEEALRSQVKYSGVYFTSERLDISWGSSTQVWMELLLFKEAYARGPYSYYHIFSGVDLPLRPADEIYNFFQSHKGKQFIHYSTDDFIAKKGTKYRVSLYHFLQQRVGRKKSFLMQVERASLVLQRILGIDRTRSYGRAAAAGANWASVTQELVDSLVKDEAWVRKHFRWCRNADEAYLQTYVNGTRFRGDLYVPDPQDDYRSCMRYIDFSRGDGNGSPYTWRSSDFDELIHSGFMFARKFDLNVDPDICYRLEAYLLNKGK